MRNSSPKLSLKTILVHWLGGIRLYIACLVVLITLETWWWASTSYAGSTLFATRLEETYAWLSVGFLSAALLIGPLCATFRQLPGQQLLRDARRLLGVGAAWFASLHVVIVYDSLFKFANPLHLPQSYQQSFLYGLVALVILLTMAATSFDYALQALGKWWFRLHRLVYVAALLVLLHAFLVGTHATAWLTLSMLSIVALVIVGLHSYLAFVRQDKPRPLQLITIGLAILLLIVVFKYGYSQHPGNSPRQGKNAYQAR